MVFNYRTLVNESMIVSDNKKVQMFIYIGFVLLETCDRLHRNKRTCVVLKIRTRHFFLDRKRLAPFWWSHYTVMSLPFCHQFIGRVTKARLIFLKKQIQFIWIHCDTNSSMLEKWFILIQAKWNQRNVEHTFYFQICFAQKRNKNSSANI